MIDSLVDPYVLLDAVRDDAGRIVDFVYVDMNDAACVDLCRSRDRLIGTRLLELYPDPAEAGLFDMFVEAFESGRRSVREGFFRRHRGTGVNGWFDLRVVRVGAALSFTWRDVSDSYRTHRQLETTAALLERTGGIAGIGGWEHDLESGERVWSSEIYRILEIDLSVTPSMDLAMSDYLTSEAQAKLAAAVDHAIATRTRWDLELPAVTATGRPIWVRAQGEPVMVDGVVVKTLGALHDITQRRRLEAQVLQAAKTDAIGRLAGGVAHDFNNMLAVILGRAEIALSKLPVDDASRADLVDIHTAAERSADLTRQLLTFARQQTVEPRVFAPIAAVTAMASMLHRLIGPGILLTWNPSPDGWPISIDPSQFDQVLTNLVVNSRDAIIHTGTTITTGTIALDVSNTVVDDAYCAGRWWTRPGDFVRLTITDNGAGIDEHTQANIFDPFFTTKEFGTGAGLGLSTVYGIVKQNNGFITITSAPGAGATFEIFLPRHHGPIEPAPGPQPVERDRRGHETILVVEDEPSILELITDILETQGYTVLAATSAEDAVRLAREYSDRIDLLLTDVVMPDINGRDLATALTAAGLHARHLFMSGYPADVITHTSVLDDSTHFIPKPFTINALTTKVRDTLDTEPEPALN
jgi:signal transduction histidine kinase/ActR/RegA family two-component response regulator